MLTPEQKAALDEIDRQVLIIRSGDSNVIPVEGDLQAAINNAPNGSILDLQGREHLRSILIDKPLTIRNGRIQAPPNTNDVVNITGDHINLGPALVIRGDGTTKRGIAANGYFMVFDGIEVRNIRRAGQESQAICIWNSTGPLAVRNTILEAGSIGFLAGGARPTIENTIPTGLTFDNVLFTRPLEWRGQGYACKNSFELKCAQDVTVRNCTLENVWVEGQTGNAIVLTVVNYGNSPNAVVQNVEFVDCTIRNVGNGINALGFGQQVDPTLRGNNYRFIRCNWNISRARMGDQGAIVKLGKEPENILFDGNNAVQDGDAFIRVSDSRPIQDFRFINSEVNKPGTYGVFTPIGSRGAGWNQVFPGGLIESCVFHDAHSIFKVNFPNNTYVP